MEVTEFSLKNFSIAYRAQEKVIGFLLSLLTGYLYICRVGTGGRRGLRDIYFLLYIPEYYLNFYSECVLLL